MSKSYDSPRSFRRSLLLLLCFLLSSLALHNPSHTQTSGCPPTTNDGWAKNTTVYYAFNSNITPGQRTQIANALNSWDAANQTNGSGVRFLPADQNHPATLGFSNSDVTSGVAARTISVHDTTTGATTSAGVVFYTQSKFENGTPMYLPNAPGYDTIYQKAALHELGHTMGLGEAGFPNPNVSCGGQQAGATVMNSNCGTNDHAPYGAPDNAPTTVTNCDNQSVSSEPSYGSGGGGGGGCESIDADGDGWDSCTDCDDTNYDTLNNCGGSCPEPCTPPLESGCGYGGIDYCAYPGSGCPSPSFPWDSCCCTACPILIDISGNGFDLTNGPGGVQFDINGDGRVDHPSWTAADSDEAWLALDRNANGVIDSGIELFGNFTPQPPSADRNGFLALAEFDKPANGGNLDGVIDARDAIFSILLLWQDTNHNGISESGELHTLPALGLASLELDYKESRRVDQYGNRFRYRARVRDTHGAHLRRWAWDVFLVP